MNLELTDPQTSCETIVTFIRQTYQAQGKTQAVIAISGGIDSALALTLLTQALGAKQITVLLLPYGEQSVALGQVITQFNHLPDDQVMTHNIKQSVDVTAKTLQLQHGEMFRLGNLKARTRMLYVYDTAKQLDALVCGTENKSEHYLGYFTRFGDAASDLEPLVHLYKTQVRQLARYLGLPAEIISQAPSAGLWPGQTDEAEMDFTYDQADEVLTQLLDESKPKAEITVSDGSLDTVAKVLHQVESMSFKLAVPYQLIT